MRSLIILLIPVFLTLSGREPANEWKLYTEDEGIKVYTRLNESERFKEVRIQFRMKASLSAVKEVLNHAPGYINWVYRCINSKRLKTLSPDAFYYYVETDMPFPVSNRDLIVFSRQSEDPLTHEITSSSIGVPEFVPENPDIVRIPFFQSQWKILPVKNGELVIDYHVKTDPGGSLPAWIVNWGVAIGPIQTMKSFRDKVQQVK